MGHGKEIHVRTPQCLASSSENEIVYPGLVLEPHLPLGRMHVDVDLLRIYIEK